MPNYTYSCDKCNKSFELFFYIKDYVEKPKCFHCGSTKTQRSYIVDVSSQTSSIKKTDSELRTIGDLANRNRDRMSNDEKIALYNKHNSYKQQPEKPLPKGMTRMKKGTKTIWPT